MAEGPQHEKKSLRHELRTCVNQILGYSELVQEELARSDQGKFIDDLKRVSNAARRLQSLVDQVPKATFDGSSLGVPPPKWAPSAAPTPAETAAPGGAPRASAAGLPATVLVVDDDENNRDVLGRVLQLKGYAVVLAASGPEALEIVSSKPVDLVLLDIMMPDVSGLDVLKALRASHARDALPVIMATAKDQPKDVVDALEMGANDYVTKPLDFAVVMARIEAQSSAPWARSAG